MSNSTRTAALLLSTMIFFAPNDLSATESSKPKDAIRIVCFGDSITGEHPRRAHLDRYMKWSDLLQLLIESQPGAPGVEVLNRGWAGDKVAAQPQPEGDTPPGGVVRFKADLIDEKPDIAVILMGANDAAVLKQNDPALTEQARKAVYEGLSKIVSECKAAGIRVLLLQYHKPNAVDMSRVWVHSDQFNDIIARVAGSQDVPTLQLAPAFKEAEKSHSLSELCNQTDGVHLDPYGEIVVARCVFDKLRSLGWLQPLKKS